MKIGSIYKWSRCHTKTISDVILVNDITRCELGDDTAQKQRAFTFVSLYSHGGEQL